MDYYQFSHLVPSSTPTDISVNQTATTITVIWTTLDSSDADVINYTNLSLFCYLLKILTSR